jgi:hypothetical protein
MYISSDKPQSAFRLVLAFEVSSPASMAVPSVPSHSVLESLLGPQTQRIV